jgi:hypothetical protein
MFFGGVDSGVDSGVDCVGVGGDPGNWMSGMGRCPGWVVDTLETSLVHRGIPDHK